MTNRDLEKKANLKSAIEPVSKLIHNAYRLMAGAEAVIEGRESYDKDVLIEAIGRWLDGYDKHCVSEDSLWAKLEEEVLEIRGGGFIW